MLEAKFTSDRFRVYSVRKVGRWGERLRNEGQGRGGSGIDVEGVGWIATRRDRQHRHDSGKLWRMSSVAHMAVAGGEW